MTRGLAVEQRDIGIRKKEKPGRGRALLTNILFSQLYFASLAIWCVSATLCGSHFLIDDIALGGLHQFRFRVRHRLQRRIAVAALDGFFDRADRATHLGAARLVDDGAAGILRVAFLAEVVLAMFSTILRLSSLGWSGLSAPAVQIA